MKKLSSFFCFFLAAALLLSAGTLPFDRDIIKTDRGDLTFTFIGHGTLMLEFNRLVIHVDPFSRLADYGKLPKADLILVTHHHRDHLDPEALKHIKTAKTNIVAPEVCARQIEGCLVMGNGETKTVSGLKIEAVPAYNILHKRESGEPYHKKGEGNGYIITFGDKRVYVAGDTENIPEMKKLKDIDIAFLPMNLPYTMTPEMAADAARSFLPSILYPYHYGGTDTDKLVELLEGDKGIEVRIRRLYPPPAKIKNKKM